MYYRLGQPVMNLDFPGGQAVVEIVPETAKLNVNSATPEDLLRLITALGVPGDRAEEIAAAIVDWRSPVNPLHGSAFDAFYLNQSPSFSPPHSSYQENEELLLTKGITPGIYYGESLDNSQPGLRDCLSVYGSGGAVDVNSAQAATLQAVGLGVEDAKSIVATRAIHPFLDYTELGRLQMSLGTAGTRLIIGGQSMYTLRATARLKRADGKLSDLRRSVGALVHFTFPGNAENKPVGFRVIRWYDRT
jgi:general secretion pathway protein K